MTSPPGGRGRERPAPRLGRPSRLALDIVVGALLAAAVVSTTLALPRLAAGPVGPALNPEARRRDAAGDRCDRVASENDA
jgi:hypothetical protein